MKKILLVAFVVFVSAQSLIAESFFNPWREIKVSLACKKGEKFSQAVASILAEGKKNGGLDYLAHVEKIRPVFARVKDVVLVNDVVIENESLGLALSRLCGANHIAFVINEEILFELINDKTMIRDDFYQISESTREKIIKAGGGDKYLELSGIAVGDIKNIDFEITLKMAYVRASDRTHELVKKLFSE